MKGPQPPPSSVGREQGAAPRDGDRASPAASADRASPAASAPRYGRYVGLLALLILALITVNTLTTTPNGSTGVEAGRRLPPFAVPLVQGSLNGDANVATRSGQGSAGSVPACSVRGAQVLNICQLYERGPVVLALFVDGGSCPAVLGEMQALARSFPAVRFAAVAIKGERAPLRRLMRARGLTLPVGIDTDGVLVALYKDASCPQISFAYPGGIVQSRALLNRPSLATLRARVNELLAAARARGWSPARG